MNKIEVRGLGKEEVDGDLGARVVASEDVELQLVPVLQLEAEAGALLFQTAPVEDVIAVCLYFLSLSFFLFLPVFVFLYLSTCVCVCNSSSCLCLPMKNGNLVAQDLRLVHVVRRHQDRPVLLVLQHQVPNVP